MILAVDIGNTNIVIGILNETQVLASGRIGTEKNKTSLDYLIQFKIMFDVFHINIEQIEGGILSSVVPELTHQVLTAMEEILGKKVWNVGAGIKTGLNIKIDSPQTLGADRVADGVAAIEEYEGPIIIIDMGTATTISVIDKNRTHIGGMIIPGMKTSLDALTHSASQLPTISLDIPKKVIGKNTVECMRSGILYGTIAMIDGLIDKILADLGYSCTIIATGGLSKGIVPYCKHKIIIEENLLLKGLYYIYKKNCEG